MDSAIKVVDGFKMITCMKNIFKDKKVFLYITAGFLLLHLGSQGQKNTEITLSNSTMVSSGSDLPFWFWANRDGLVKPGESFLNLTCFDLGTKGQFENNKDWSYRSGLSLAGGLADESYFQINQLFAAVDYKGWQLSGGMFLDKEQFGGLSTTNGNLARSRNARPVPGIRISTPDYKPVPGVKDWLSFRFEYDEGFLNDERYVENAHLHHKSLFFKIKPSAKWTIQAGVEHFVMWGGTSQNDEIGKMPSDFKAYLEYITGKSGSADFPTTEQQNVAGNQYGTYQLKVSREFDDFTLHFNVSHPFEDLSGVNLRNWPDNLLGLYIEFMESDQIITDILYEFANTRQQSYIKSSKRGDNYYNHWNISLGRHLSSNGDGFTAFFSG